MDKLIEVLVNLIPFCDLLKSIGLSEEKSLALATVLNALIIWGVIAFIKFIAERHRNSKIAKDLHPQFDYKSIKDATQFYQPTQSQNASPARQDEPGFAHKYVFKKPLIPFFLKTAFKYKNES